MVAARDAAKDNGAHTAGATTLTVPTPSGGYAANKLLIAACICGLDPSGLSIDNGFTIRKIVNQFGVCGLAVATKDNSAGTEANVKWTSGGGSTGMDAGVIQVSGIVTASSMDANPAGTHSGGVQVATLAGPATGTLAQADEYICTVLGVVGDLATPTCAGGGAVVFNQSNRLVFIEQIVSATASKTHTPSWANNNFADVITLTFKASTQGVEITSGFQAVQ